MYENTDYRTIYALLRAVRMHRKALHRKLDSTGVYQEQHRLLMRLSDNRDFASQRELAEKLGISTATLAVSLKKLEKGGYLEKKMDEKDNRVNRITITEKGEAVVADSLRYFSEVDGRAMAGFSEREKEQLRMFLDRVSENLREADEDEHDN